MKNNNGERDAREQMIHVRKKKMRIGAEEWDV